MIHYMNLVPTAFVKIADGNKTIELRLNDEKRQRINVEDTVVFDCSSTKDIITAQISGLHKFSNFKELYNALPLEKCGYTVAELDTAHYTDMEQYYTKEQIKKYGALGIELCNVSSICDVKEIITEPDILKLLAPSVYNPTEERLLNRSKKYQEDENTNIYAYKDNGEHKGIVIFKIANNSATILDIAVKPEYQGQGIGSILIDFIFDRFEVDNITAETDDDAIGFYKKYGFTVANTKVEFDTKRYVCVCESVTHHYDLLIDENNDPVHDPKPLQDYMDKWDGQVFVDKMELNKDKSVLEIGVGTGRLAIRVAHLCGDFYGVDISQKTIERAKENLTDFKNVTLNCADFLSYEFGCTFDVVYSSLTFMHIEDKQKAINKVATLLKNGGRFVLSIDKNQERFIDTGTRKIRIFSDTPEEIKTHIANSCLLLIEHYETEFAHIFVATKE
ncbi:MAG: GNAT family N-acetyltransferase [Clostridia bacterium]|nr:GNAT family N-acetyltransferase [Clostridia bacterium]